ncbi:MAG: hypothetical protein AAF449_13975 [Myxococcota bacterium]
MKVHHRPQQRGFALLFIVMIVAVVAVAAAALLDIVEVDLLIAGEHRRSAVAQAIAEGAVIEIQADEAKENMLPTAASPNLTIRYAGIDGAGDFVRDPDGVDFGPVVMTNVTSAYVQNNAAVTAAQREGYIADMRLIRTGPVINSGVRTAHAVVYEIRVQSSAGGGQASSEVFAEAFQITSVQAGRVGNHMHFR